MEFLKFIFPLSGVETYILIPPLEAFGISFFTSMGGISGAFLLLPFQMSVLGFTSPSVTATNFLFNVTGIPGGVYRYARECRFVWPVAMLIVVGTIPGVLYRAVFNHFLWSAGICHRRCGAFGNLCLIAGRCDLLQSHSHQWGGGRSRLVFGHLKFYFDHQ